MHQKYLLTKTGAVIKMYGQKNFVQLDHQMSLLPKEAQRHRMVTAGRDHWWGHAHMELAPCA